MKPNHVGAPAVFSLELACKHLNAAFDGQCYLVGSALERPDWRDIDVRLMLDDEAFARLFPAIDERHHEFDPRWLVMTTAISAWLSKITGLPVDFQFQEQSAANRLHSGNRSALGLTFRTPSPQD